MAISIRISMAISIRIAVVIAVVSIGLRLSISRPLAKTLGRPGLEGGAGGVESNTGVRGIGVAAEVPIGVAVVAIQSGGISLSLRLSISGPLATAPKAGGGESGGRDSGPVRVGVVEGRVGRVVGSVEEARVSLRIRGSRAPGQQDTQNLNKKIGFKLNSLNLTY